MFMQRLLYRVVLAAALTGPIAAYHARADVDSDVKQRFIGVWGIESGDPDADPTCKRHSFEYKEDGTLILSHKQLGPPAVGSYLIRDSKLIVTIPGEGSLTHDILLEGDRIHLLPEGEHEEVVFVRCPGPQ